MSGMMMGVAGSPQLSRTGAMTGSHVCMCRWGYRRDGAGSWEVFGGSGSQWPQSRGRDAEGL